MTHIHLSAIIVVALMIALPTGCIYAERQAKDIKACESVGARWQYSSLTKQVNCVPNRKYMDED